MTGKLEGKVALVTGGSSGIGRASAIAFAREDAKVVVVDINIPGGEETVQIIKEAGGVGYFFKADVSKAAEVEESIKITVKTYGELNYAFNNAGGGTKIASTTDCTEENWDRVINLNLKGVWLCMKYEIPQMLSHGGAIVNTASVLGLVGKENMPAYVAAKHGVIGVTKAAALEYARANIRVNAVCPGVVITPATDRMMAKDPHEKDIMLAQIPMGRFGNPSDVAEAVVWLCSDAATFVTGIAMAVDGGSTVW